MIPSTREDAERAARSAILAGDFAAIERATRALDSFDAPAREQTPIGTLSAALWYAEQGLQVFPLSAGSKVPWPGTRGFKDATSDELKLRQWWARWPDSNLGLATGHMVDVIDFDGLKAHESWAARYGGSWGGLDIRAVVSTPRPGGLHVWVPVLTRSRNRARIKRGDIALDGVDVRGLGGYVVLPPSTIKVGPHPGSYRFIRPYVPKPVEQTADDPLWET